MTVAIVKTGKWMYGGSVELPVDIVSINYDWWHELAMADGMLERDETAMSLNEDGWIFYVRFKKALSIDEPTWVDSPGHQRLEDAIRYAEAKVGGIKWD